MESLCNKNNGMISYNSIHSIHIHLVNMLGRLVWSKAFVTLWDLTISCDLRWLLEAIPLLHAFLIVGFVIMKDMGKLKGVK